MRCRRREEPASVLVARLPARVRISPERVLACFRLTDSVSIARIRDGYEIAGVFDEDGFEREGLELRLRAALDGIDARIGWMRFPDDGVTLEVLLENARAALPAPAGSSSGRRAGALFVRAARATARTEER
jgi:hypothetical protein